MVELAFIGMINVKDVREATDDDDIGWVDPGGWVILVVEALEKSPQ